MMYDPGTILFVGWEWAQAISWARENNLTQDDVKIYKEDWQILVMARRGVEMRGE